MGKRGQVTVFIIIGIVVLFVFAGILFISKAVVKEKLNEEGMPIIEKVPQEFVPLQIFTENCLLDTGKTGLIILGQQGGYIYPSLLGEFSTSKPTDSAGINMEPASIPYWHYNSQLNGKDSIVFESLKPALHYTDDPKLSVEAQLRLYVEENLDNCLEDYASFTKQGFSVSTGEQKAKAEVGANGVGFTLQMTLKMEKGGSSAEMNTFYVKVPLDLNKYYNLASQITNAERNYSFLEKQTLDLIHIFSGVNVNKLPPTSGVTFEMVPTVYWVETDVKEKLKGLLNSYVPMLRFLGSKNFYGYTYPDSDLSDLYQKNYDNAVIPLSGGEGLEISFDYLGWNPYFDINSKGDKIEPQHVGVHYWMLHFGTQNYYTVYDLSYPVLVTLRDPNAFNGEGFTFVFALESNIRNNKPAEDQEKLPKPVAAVSESMVCDADKWNTGLLNTLVIDSFTGEPLDQVQIGFSVSGQDSCTMGLTDRSGRFESNFPTVYGGVVDFIKTDYLVSFYPIDTYQYKDDKPGIIGYAAELADGSTEEVIELHKFKRINATVKKKNLEKCINNNCFFSGVFSKGKEAYSFVPESSDSKHTWSYTGAVHKLGENDQAIITLTRVGDVNGNLYSQEHSIAVTVNGDEQQEIDLVPGIYSVTGNLLLNEEVVIPEEERCTGGISEALACWDVDGCCFTMEETLMSSFIAGQITWETKDTYLTITPEDLYPSESVTFYILNQNIKGVPAEAGVRVIEDLQVMGEMPAISQESQIRNSLNPTFS